MRTIWVTAIAVMLGIGTTGYAQDSMMKKLLFRPTNGGTEVWAGQYATAAPATQTAPAAALAAPITIVPAGSVVVATTQGTPTQTDTAPSQIVPATPPHDLPSAPPMTVPTAGCGCGTADVALTLKCQCKRHDGHLCKKILGWFCWHPLHGCCGEIESCCALPPLYLYTFHECVGCGEPLTPPPCCTDKPVQSNGRVPGPCPFFPLPNGSVPGPRPFFSLSSGKCSCEAN